MLWLRLSCLTASLLLWRAAVVPERQSLPASLELYSNFEAKPCEVTHLVLHASTDGSCDQHCRLLLSQLYKPQESNVGDRSAGLQLASPLLSSNIASLSQNTERIEEYLLELVCHTSSNCIANPSGWHLLQTPSALEVWTQADTGHVPNATGKDAAAAGCITELNTTVTHTVTWPSSSAQDATGSIVDGTGSTLITWSIRIAMLVCFTVLQRAASIL